MSKHRMPENTIFTLLAQSGMAQTKQNKYCGTQSRTISFLGHGSKYSLHGKILFWKKQRE